MMALIEFDKKTHKIELVILSLSIRELQCQAREALGEAVPLKWASPADPETEDALFIAETEEYIYRIMEPNFGVGIDG